MSATPPTPRTDENGDGRLETGVRMVRELLTDPDAFFRRQADEPSFRGPAVVVLFVIGLRLAGSLPTLRATASALPEEAGAFVPLIYLFSAIGGVVGTLISWLLYAGAFHVISAVGYGASGRFRDMVALTGWGFVPRIPEAGISAAIAYYVFSGRTFPADPARLGVVMEQLRSDPLLQLATILGIVFLLWSAFLWTFAVRHGRGLSLRQAAVTVGIPVSIGVGINLLSSVGVV